MKFSAGLITISALVAEALAKVQLTNSAYVLTANTPFTITWSDAVGSVTLTLKEGASNDLDTVSTIATGLTGTSYTWTPTMPSGTYAIEIEDSEDSNYSPQFSFQGTAAAATTTATTATAATTTDTTTSALSTTTAVTTTTGSSSASSSAATTLTTASASSSANGTSTASSSTKSTSTATSSSSSSDSTSTSTPVNTNDSKKLGSPLALIALTAAALFICQ